jgi:hydrogenase maturation factor HypF (carbamoyltransferase family)
MAKRTTITIETESLLRLRARGAQRAWCPRCGAEVETISSDLPISSPILDEVERLLESGQVHKIEAVDGMALPCLNSLLALVRKTKTKKPR